MKKKIFYRASLSEREASQTIKRSPPPEVLDESLEIKAMIDYPLNSFGNFLSGMGELQSSDVCSLNIDNKQTKLVEEAGFDLRINHTFSLKMSRSDIEDLEETTKELARFLYSQGKLMGNQAYLDSLLKKQKLIYPTDLETFLGKNNLTDFHFPKKKSVIDKICRQILKDPNSINDFFKKTSKLKVSGHAYFQVQIENNRPIFRFQGISFLPVPTMFTYVAGADRKIFTYFKNKISKSKNYFLLSADPYIKFPKFIKDKVIESDVKISKTQNGSVTLFFEKRKVYPLYLFNHVLSQQTSNRHRFLRLLSDAQAPHFMMWRWGSFESEVFKPSIKRRNVDITPRSWRISKTEFFSNIHNAKWRKKLNLPENLTIRHGSYRFSFHVNDKKFIRKFKNRLENPVYKFQTDIHIEESEETSNERSIEICLPFET